MKKITALLLALLTVFTMVTVAFADDASAEEPIAADEKTITEESFRGTDFPVSTAVAGLKVGKIGLKVGKIIHKILLKITLVFRKFANALGLGDNIPWITGAKRIAVSDITEEVTYSTVIKETYPTCRRYSVIYYPETSEPIECPVISFVHGFFFFNISDFYESTMVHLASAGYIVIAPNYENILVQTENYVSYAAAQIIDGLDYAEKLDSVIPARNEDGTYMFGLMGHSAGGVTLMNLASCWNETGIPRPQCLLTLDACDGGEGVVPLYDISSIDPDTNIMMCFGASDDDNTYRTNETFWNQLDHIDASRKQWAVLYDDHHGEEELIADHSWMTDVGRIPDNYLRYGAWKWTLAIANDSFYGKNRELWYGGTDVQTNMGEWSDGTPVHPAAVTSGDIFWEEP